MEIEGALHAHEEQVDELLKQLKKYSSALKSWKKACETGQIASLKRAASVAAEAAPEIAAATARAAESWDFDVRAYLSGDCWRLELQQACRELGLRALEEEETLVVPPVVVRAAPGQSRLVIGKKPWPMLNPNTVANYVKRLNERTASDAASQQFLYSLYDACQFVSKYVHQKAPGDLYARFCDIYNLFAHAPGWKRDNSPAAFAQQIYALDHSMVRTARDNRTFELERPSGKPKESDIFTVISAEGKPLKYYGIWFR